MKQSIHRLLMPVLLLALLFPFSDVSAQSSGNIKGQVTDNDGGALPGASVMIKGTTRGTTTNLTGTFEMIGVKEGKYTLLINYMGFKSAEQEVEVRADRTSNVSVKMASNTVALSGVTVSSVREGQQKALNQQRNADNIKQVISADLMGRYPDLNVAESMQRLPGVTIGRNSSGEGATVQLRGTPGNFTNINVNGEQIMGSSEEGFRNAQLDLIPTNVLASMEVIKTLTPDLDGDAIAGQVNMKSPTATSLKPRLTVDAGLGYNDLRSKANGIGNISLGKRFFATKANPNGALGLMATGSYYKTTNGYDDIRAQVWEKKDYGKGPIWFPTDIRYLYVENQRVRQGLSATADFSFSPVTSIVVNYMYSDHDNDLTRYRKRTRMQSSRTTQNAQGTYVTTRGRSYNEIRSASEDNKNSNINVQFETRIGRVRLDAGGFYSSSKAQTVAGTYNFITGDIPLNITDIYTDDLMAIGTDWKNNASLFTYNTVERDNWNTKGRNVVGKLNASYDYKIGNNSATFKMGGKVKRMHNNRWRPNTALVANYTGNKAAGNLTNFSGNPEVSADLLDGATNFGLGVDKDKTISFFNQYMNDPAYFTIDPAATRGTIDGYYYDAIETVSSGYVMNRIQFNRWMLIAGLRVEHTNVDYAGNIILQDANGVWQSTTPTSKTTSYTKILPNLQAKYDINKSTLIRGGVTFGYSRPNFVDLVPGRVISVLSETVTDGNPELKPAFATNFDLMAEKYLSNLGILSAGVFYKKIDKFQYTSVSTLTGNEFDGAATYANWRWFRVLNGDAANVFGVELNAQANLTFLPGFLKGFSVLANYTYSHSSADAQFRKDLRLPGQATHSANASLSYTLKGLTLQGNLNYNGDYTVSLGADAAQDVIQAARVQVDANASYRINKRFTVYAEAQNLTNAPQRIYFGQENQLYQKQFYSFWGRAGVKFRL
ncbi:MAG: TonB-dependent receptor [Citrobacter freundii]|nr:MAG: TonB-dependent receptor [Citrobacter freundii]